MASPEAAIVFGGSGFVGRNLVPALAAKVANVIAISRDGVAVPGASLSVPFAEIGRLDTLPATTVAIHLAAQRYDPARHDLAQSEILTANTGITSSIYQFCVERRITELRVASSVAVYPAGLDLLNDEEPVDLNAQPHKGEALYAWSKRWSEILAALYAERYGINTISFRLSNPYGPHDSLDARRAHVLPAFVLRALNDEDVFKLSGNPNVERDFIFVDDVVNVMIRSLAVQGRTAAMNLCRGTTTTLFDLATKIVEVSGCGKEIVTAGEAPLVGVLARRSTNKTVRKMFEVDQFADLEIGLKRTIEWYRDALG